MLRFRRLGSSRLYVGEPLDSSTGHLGEVLLLLPTQAALPPGNLSLEDAWQFQHPSGGAGYLLFTETGFDVAGMSSDEVNALASRLHSLTPRVVRNQHLSLGWVRGNPQTPSQVSLQTLAMVRTEQGVRTQNIPQALRFQQIELMFLPATPFRLEGDGSGFVLENTQYMAPPGADPRLDQPTNRRVYLRGAAAYDIDKVGDELRVPLLGGDRGSVQFDVHGLNSDDTDAGKLDTAIYYVVPEPGAGRDQGMRYPFMRLDESRRGGVDQLDFNARLFPANPMSSIFSFGGTDSSDGPLIQTYYATHHGHPVFLIPQAGAGLMFTEVPNPGVYHSRAAEVRNHYNLVPVGNFEMELDRDLPVGEQFARLIGGQSGTEYVSFVPRRAGGRGDVLSFFRGGSAYAPDFNQANGNGNGSLLTNRFTTSWLSVGIHPQIGSNGHIPKYFAQPDDAALHGEKGANDPYLEYVEVPTVDLPDPSLTDSFPLAPLSGVNAPDDRISRWIEMEKYVLFEKSILSPFRKATLTGIKRDSHATPTARRLQQGPVSTTTPQGMLVEVVGSDWTKLTLAKDDSPDTNYLEFEDVSADFQDALQTNRLFLVATREDTLKEGTSGFQRLLEIAGWPFRFDIGQAPLGFTAASGEYNNVLVFKFINQTFDEMLDDPRAWARADDFNDNVPAIQTWLKAYVQDVRDKVENAGDDEEQLALYKPLLTIFDDPNWTGILGLNVTIPPSGMPCEIQGLMGGIRKMEDFKAHHVGFAISKVLPDASDIEKSSIFALVDYGDTDPQTENPDGDPPTYEFIVRNLQVRFANSEIASFDCDLRIYMNNLFDEKVTLTGTTHNYVDMVGTYELVGNKPQYSFSKQGTTAQIIRFSGAGDFGITLLESTSITKGSLLAGECATGGSTQVTSAFNFNGSMAFRNAFAFDFFSFDKLMYSAMKLHMEFDFVDTNGHLLPGPIEYKFDPGDLGLNVGISQSRLGGLLANFPLQVNGFHYNEAGLNPTNMGYIEIPSLVPGWNGAEKPIYGLSFTIDLGPLASLLSKNAPKGAIQILAAWEPSGGGVTFGVTLGKGKNGKKEIGIEGVFLISLSDFGFQKLYMGDGDDYVYAFFLSNAFLKIFSTQIPPGGDFSLVLFVPFNGQTDKVNMSNLGWFISYQRGSAAGGGAPGEGSVQPSISASPGTTVTRGQEITFTVTAANQMPIPVNNTIRMNLIATEGSTGGGTGANGGRPLPPAPQSLTKFINANGSASYVFKWPATQVGTFSVSATASASGQDGNSQQNARGTSPAMTITVNPASGDNAPADKKKTSIVKVEYLGIGSRVQAPGSLAAVNSVESMISHLKQHMTVTGSGDALKTQLKSIYNPNAGLLIAFDLTILEFVRLAVVFAQENQIYGALIGFAERAPAFIKGFQFQILYKQVTDDIGVFHMLLKLPDALRRWDIGQGTLTLPVIGLDIYTNGNFKLDLGFPYNFDFSRSLKLEMIIMIGPVPLPLTIAAGFYFSYLTGATSKLVPKLTENLPSVPSDQLPMFDPVFEAGLGLQIGIGREVNYGVLKAGALIALEVLLEGAMAWYWPNGRSGSDAGKPSFIDFPDWFRVSGQAGLIAKLWGAVDFKIIKVSVSIELSARFHFIFETYKDILFGITVTVKVNASIKIAFVRISFSFNAKLSFEFTVPNPMGDAPWDQYLPTRAPLPITRMLAQNPPVVLVPADWNAMPAISQPELNLHFTTAVTSGRNGSGTAAYAVALLTMPENEGMRLVEALTRWALYLEIGDATTVSRASLERLDMRLNPQPEAGAPIGPPDRLIPYGTLTSFLSTAFAGVSISDAPTTDTASVIFPMMPEASLTWGDDGARDLSDVAYRRDEEYHDDLFDYFEMLKVDVLDKSDFLANRRSLQQTNPVPMAQTVFEDYFEMLVKGGVGQAVQYAREQGEDFSLGINELMERLRTQAIPDGDGHTWFQAALHMNSRYFAHGLRFPGEIDGTNWAAISETAVGLYENTGQQVLIPNQWDDENDAPWTLNLNVNTGWASGGGTFAVDQYDPDGGAIGWLQQFQNASVTYPAINEQTLRPMPPLRSELRKFAFRQPMEYLRNNSTAGYHFPLSEIMLQALEGSGTPNVNLFNPGGTALSNTTWSLRIPFTAKRISRMVTETSGGETSTTEEFVPNAYEIAGTDEATRALIEACFTYLESAPANAVNSVELFYSLFGFDDQIFSEGAPRYASIMKTNLSTISAPQETSLQQFGPIDPDEFAADLIADNQQAYRFLRLIYEASIVNADGFYLAYDNGTDESGLPDDAFRGAENTAQLTLEVRFTAPVPGINTLSIGDPAFDIENSALYAEIDGHFTYHPALAPGAVAFELLRERPSADVDPEVDAAAYLQNMFQLLSYRILESDAFHASIRGLPVGPLDEDGIAEWFYQEGIKVNRFLKSGADGRYAAVGTTATLELEFLDVFGNQLPPPSEGLPEIALPVRYSDPLVGVAGWPGIGLSYAFSTSGVLEVSLTFNHQSYIDDINFAGGIADPDARARAVEEAHNRRLGAGQEYRKILEQLQGPNVSVIIGTTVNGGTPAPQSLNAVTSFVDGIASYLETPHASWPPATTPQTDLAFSASVAASNSDPIFPVQVWVAIERRVDDVIDQYTNLPEIQRARTIVPPEAMVEFAAPPSEEHDVDSGVQHAHEQFARDFEAAFGGFKVATGLGEDGPQTIWAVNTSAVNFQQPGSPFFYAPPPLSKVLLERESVPIRDSWEQVANEIDPAGPDTTGASVSFTEVDLDVWGREFLQAVDRLLSPSLAVSARRIAPEPFRDIMIAKADIAEAIANSVTHIIETSGASDHTDVARESYRQQLLASLSSAYDVETAIVFPVGTTGQGGLFPPRAYGNVSGTPVGWNMENAGDDPRAGFTMTPAKIDLSGQTEYVPVLFSSGRTHSFAAAHINVKYKYSHIEHDIQAADADEYQASSWLTLVLPEDPRDFGTIDVPIPLREFPLSPELAGQEAVAAYQGTATTLAEAKGWEYHYSITQPAVAQDTTISQIDFNVPADGLTRSLLSHELTLFDWLARFHREYPRFSANLELLTRGLTELDGTPEMELARQAVTWFANIIKGAGDTWQSWVTDQAVGTRFMLQNDTALLPYDWTYTFTERIDFGQSRSVIDLSAVSSDPGRFPVRLPRFRVMLEDGSMTEATRSNGRFSYPWAGNDLIEYRPQTLIIDDLDVLNTENAWGSIRLLRNLNLSSSGSRTTNDRFVYETETARFVNKVTPLLDTIVPINLWPGGGQKNLGQHLRDTLHELFNTAGETSLPRLLKIGVRYAYDVRGQEGPAEGPDQLDEYIAYMPILQRMPFMIRPTADSGSHNGDPIDGINSFVDRLVSEINSWRTTIGPSTSRAFYEIDLSVFAGLSNTDLPVLRLRRLWLGLDKISE